MSKTKAVTKAVTSYKIILGDFNGLPKNQKNEMILARKKLNSVQEFFET